MSVYVSSASNQNGRTQNIPVSFPVDTQARYQTDRTIKFFKEQLIFAIIFRPFFIHELPNLAITKVKDRNFF